MRISKDLDYRFKVILLGDSKVGKSSIVNRIVEEGFNLKYNETTFFDTVNKKLRVNNQYDVLL
jgi:GTPase SAR1 family protein